MEDHCGSGKMKEDHFLLPIWFVKPLHNVHIMDCRLWCHQCSLTSFHAFIYVAHDTLSKVGLTSTGSGAGHCAGANRPGHFSLFYIGDFSSFFIGSFHLFLLVLFHFFVGAFSLFLLVIFHFFIGDFSLFYIGDFSLGPTNFSRALCEGQKLPGMD